MDAETQALRAWRRENGLPEIANPPLHYSDVPFDHDGLWDRFEGTFREVLTVLANLRRRAESHAVTDEERRG